ncbi:MULTISPECIES: TIGR00266 family protein [Coprobacillaceae]|uniref:TIGR00266 family protein n=1 Tax=Coprobacillaceae TaxID=2810280 RepID=UPI000E498DC1|nr:MULTISPECIES: TIGR00266 family protein [Coprobacillaceae]RHM59004.1 TIGR00266 family protein [Coprobacillus sp. AF33-1AC]RHS91387.1 TIGR00266 family protein [Erysipelatoclostridium sp. AM42-17]
MKYTIEGGNLPVVICHLDQDESMICDSGAMAWMDPDIEMSTKGGGFGKVLSRMISNETLFQNYYTAKKPGLIAFASSFPGQIKAVEISQDKEIIIQKSAFLASTSQVQTSLFYNKKFSTGLFGGEGFVMTKLSGTGTAFLEIDGSTVEYHLIAGQQMIIDTGYLAMMDATCTLDIQSVSGMKNKLLGGEGFFNTVVTGPGKIVLQTAPIPALARTLAPYFPSNK